MLGMRGAWRGPDDPPDVLWTVSDIGPALTCSAMSSLIDLPIADVCPADVDKGVAEGVGRVFMRPDFAPSIFKLRLRQDGFFEVLQTIPILKNDGTPITGLPNPHVAASSEQPRDGDGNVILRDANAFDPESIVRLPFFGGRFFIGEESATGLVEIASDGRVLKRFVPAGAENDYINPFEGDPAGYVVEGAMPELLAKRRYNRGIESVAVSEDYRYLYTILQSPLDNPSTAVRDSKNLRIFKMLLELRETGSTLHFVGEWVYELDDLDVLLSVGVTDLARRRDLRLSEMVLIGPDRFVAIERTDEATALYEIDLTGATNILNTKWDSPAQSPTLEQLGLPDFPTLADEGIVPVKKTLRFIASSLDGASPQFAPKLEGIALTQDGNLILINDSDYGTTNETTRIDVVTQDPANDD